MHSFSIFSAATLAFLLVSCSHEASSTTPTPALAPTSSAPQSQPATAPLAVRFLGPHGELPSGDPMKSGTQFEMGVTVGQPSYLYIVQFSADHSIQQIYPAATPTLLSAGVEQRVPGDGNAFQLDQTTGEESLYFILSPQPIDRVDQELSVLLKGVNAPSTTPAPGADANQPSASGSAPAPSSAPPSVAPSDAARRPTTTPGPHSSPPRQYMTSNSFRSRDPFSLDQGLRARAVELKKKRADWSKGIESIQSGGAAVFRVSFAHTAPLRCP